MPSRGADEGDAQRPRLRRPRLGLRAQAGWDPRRGPARARRGDADLSHRQVAHHAYPELVEALEEEPATSFVADGEIAFGEWTRDGKLLHPRYLGLREDKPAAEVVRERPAA